MVEAEAEFRRVIVLTPDNPRGCSNAGAVCFRQGRLEEAETLFRRSADIRPTAPVRHARQARALSARALRLAPGDGSVLATAAGIDTPLGDHEHALRKIARSVRAGYSSWEIAQSPSFAALKADPRFEAALKGAAPVGGGKRRP